MKIVIAGGTGLCGKLLCAYFAAKGDEVIVLSRKPVATNGVAEIAWDGKTDGAWADVIDGADVIINLAGRSVNCRYHAANRVAIYASRLDSTRAIGRAIAAAVSPPPIWINASSATIYRDARDRPMDEATGEIGTGFSVDVCQNWERALFGAPTPKTRRVALRSAIVFSSETGGVWHPFYWLARLGLAGPMDGGRHMVSWVHGEDYCRTVDWIVSHPSLSGPINVASPNPVSNREFLKAVRIAVGQPIGIPSARWMLEVAAFLHRTETELLLKSRWVVPGILTSSGFTFLHPNWPEAAREIAAAMRPSREPLRFEDSAPRDLNRHRRLTPRP